jgi:hypothetical protein
MPGSGSTWIDFLGFQCHPRGFSYLFDMEEKVSAQSIHLCLQDEAFIERLYTYMVDEVGNGPFDGGCYLFAKACQSVLGGSIAVLRGSERGGPSIVQHFLLKVGDNQFLDTSGLRSSLEVCKFWDEEEGVEVADILPVSNKIAYEWACSMSAHRNERHILGIANLLSDPVASVS